MYASRDRLAGVLNEAVATHGHDVLRDPQRAHRLLSDQYAAHGYAERADVDQLVSALNGGFDNIVAPHEPPETVARWVAENTGMALEDASWTVATLRSLPRSAESPSLPHPAPVPGPVSEPASEVQSSTARSWPGSAKVAVAILAVLALAAIAAALIVRSGDETSKYKKQVAELNDELDEQSATADEDLQEMTAKADALQGQVTEAQAKVDELTQQVADLDDDGTETEAQIADLTEQLAAAQRDLSTAQQQATDAADAVDGLNAQIEELSKPFNVASDTVTFPTTRFTFRGTATQCDGFQDDTCDLFNQFNGFIRQDGGNLFFEIPDVVRIPLEQLGGGLAFTGEAGSRGAAISCQDSQSETVIQVTLTPNSLFVDPAQHTATGTSMFLTILFFSPEGGGCVDSTQAYAGTATF